MVRAALGRLNFFRKVPDELQVHSSSGAFFSLCSFLVMGFLILSHYQSYRRASTRSIVTLDSHQEDRLRINFNVTLTAIPCRYASVDLSDHMGLKLTNITRHVRHFRVISSLSSNQTQRLEEVVIAPSERALPVWGGAQRSAAEGIHYSTPLTTTTFSEFMQKYELVLVNYYAPWCPYSQVLHPEWERAAAQLQDHPEYAERVMMASVDCTDDNAAFLCRRAHVRAFPSMLIYIYGNTYTRFMYNGPRTAEHLLQFLDLFYRRLEPDADFAEEIRSSLEVRRLPEAVSHDNVNAIALPRSQVPLGDDVVEGCEVSGSLSVNRVPGKLEFTARATGHSFDLTGVNVSHTVNHFSFGQIRRTEHLLDGLRMIVPSFRYPLDGLKFSASNKNITIEHFMNVVGFDHLESRVPLFGIVQRLYEFSASSNQYNATNMLPAALFTFDISPLVIQIVADNMPFYKFLTSLCAVIGGVFTIIGLLDSGVFHAMNSIQKKQQLGKLH